MKVISPELEQISTDPTVLGESPLWCPLSRSIFWIECEDQPSLFRIAEGAAVPERWRMPQRIGAVALHSAQSVLVALADGVYVFDLAKKTLERLSKSPNPETLVLHEGKCDRQGRFWIGSLSKRMQSHGERGGASLYRLDGDMLVPKLNNLSVGNGLAWSPGGQTLYFTDTPASKVWAFDYDIATGEISHRRVFLEVEPDEGMLDGAAMDRDGGYWIALFRGSAVRRYTPDGKLDLIIELPFSQPTMAAFGGPGMDDLYLTTTRYGMSKNEVKASTHLGHVFLIRSIGYAGVAETPYAG